MSSNSETDKNESVLDIIRVMDKQYKVSPFYTFLTFQFIGFLIFFFTIYLAVVLYVSVARNEIFNILTLLIAFLALFFPYATSTSKSNSKNLEERNYYFISRDYSEKTSREKIGLWIDLFYGKKANEKPLLKALIKMKARNPRLKLEDLYNREKSIFSEKNLLEKLVYE